MTLVAISQFEEGVNMIIKTNFIEKSMEHIKKNQDKELDPPLLEGFLIVFNNLTIEAEGREAFLNILDVENVDDEDLEDDEDEDDEDLIDEKDNKYARMLFFIKTLTKAYATNVPLKETLYYPKRAPLFKDQYDVEGRFLNVILNVSAHQEGRIQLYQHYDDLKVILVHGLDPEKTLLQRKGCIGLLRNCLFEVEQHVLLRELDLHWTLWKLIQAEKNYDLRRDMIECLHMMCFSDTLVVRVAELTEVLKTYYSQLKFNDTEKTTVHKVLEFIDEKTTPIKAGTFVTYDPDTGKALNVFSDKVGPPPSLE
eukprot:CAMPEP_0117427984 /NCGR_PEP_ID=MMETSP0758-20121206/7766_1 /TAXON_ID=63605 /ORGANISM="Percolomonas cosmopolitus, Strain AE-1 (ATCC 50343)" /LENGTH=309 /DNA_ID=CAMNT_0005214035 /DNA_START=164 /DNA_END=1090 /DNA_ORIENTATION=+